MGKYPSSVWNNVRQEQIVNSKINSITYLVKLYGNKSSML